MDNVATDYEFVIQCDWRIYFEENHQKLVLLLHFYPIVWINDITTISVELGL